jgi:His-Xaa-Ser system radical SAM maturase HxsB
VNKDDLAARVERKHRYLSHGPKLHIMVVTLRCNETCVYCHASRAEMDRVDTDMSKETAEKSVELALRSTAPAITIEFQGGEPLANFPVVKHIIEHALAKNRAYGKTLDFTMVSNLALMDDEKLDYLVEKKVQICTSIDGPAALHDKQRKLVGGSAHAQAVKWIKRINERYASMGLDPTLYHVEALLTTTRDTLEKPVEIVDAYVELGCRALFLRPVDPFGFAARTGEKIGTAVDAYLEFYRKAVEHVLALNKQGVQVLERFASIFLTKIMTPEDPDYLDIRSPCGAGTGQLAYNYDGRIYTCDEGRMLAASGDEFFHLGDVADADYRGLMRHDTVRAMSIASNLDAQPDCDTCVYQPYCGVCPVFNYATQGSLQGRMRDSAWCKVHKGIQDFLFTKLIEDDASTLEAFQRWTTVRERSHFVHPSAAS